VLDFKSMNSKERMRYCRNLAQVHVKNSAKFYDWLSTSRQWTHQIYHKH